MTTKRQHDKQWPRESVEEDASLELQAALRQHGSMTSCHEGYAVILEELDELWTEVKKREILRDYHAMYTEAIQVAAMALKFAMHIRQTQRLGAKARTF